MVCLSYERTTVFVSPELRTGLGIYKYHRLVIQLSGGPDPEGRRVRIKTPAVSDESSAIRTFA
jgi:hypothetical protein